MRMAVLNTLLSHWRRHPLQLVSLMMGLALATALWSGVQAINAEARNSYDRAAAVLGQDQLSRLQALDGREIAVSEYIGLRRAGWQVTPVIEGEFRIEGQNLQILGIDPLTAPPQANAPALASGQVDLTTFISGDGILLIAPETALNMTNGGLPPLVLSADVAPGIAIGDISTVQRLLGRGGLSYLLVANTQPAGLAPLSSLTDLVLTPATTQSDIAQLTDSFHLNLTAFGLLAFAVGLFIVQAAIGLAFEQRRPTFRTLRALGVPLGRLIGLLAIELGILAALSGTIGIMLGYGIAAALLPGVAGTLRGLYGANISGQLSFDATWALSALGIAMIGAALAGVQALWRVANMPLLAPAQPRAWALASARAMQRQGGLALALLTLGGALAVFGGSLATGFACLAAFLIGAALLLPSVLQITLYLVSKIGKTALSEWIFADTRQQVPGLSLALMALLLALSANIGVSTMVGSFRNTFTGWLDQRLASEIYVTARNEVEAAEITTYLIPRVQAILPIWSVETRISNLPVEIFGIVDHPTYRENWPLIVQGPDVWDRLAQGDGILINEQMFRRQGLSLGDLVDLGQGWTLRVLAVYSDYGNPAGQVIVSDAELSTRYPQVPILRMAVRIDPAEAPALVTELRAAFDLPDQNVVNQQEIKGFSLEVFEQTFLVTGALNILTLGVAGFAMLTSLLSLAAMRLPQLAPVWALGLTRAQLAWIELIRTVVLAAMTWAISIPVGLGLAWVLLAIVNVEAFGWRLPMQVFPADWLRLGVYAGIAAVFAAAWPVLKLSRLPPSDLLKVFANER
ncbi:MAG: putative ABC transport system permease protein [Paracoccaceae bacterium]|jgi:putative ABC transport system permease protein